jgi:hypothetical protein|tara:strand:- start:208 stop:462 length:255 start_codon:yes stop_codon:yes gene_type:complete
MRMKTEEEIDKMNDNEINEELVKVRDLMLKGKTAYNDTGQSEMNLVRRTAWAWVINGYDFENFMEHLEDFEEVIRLFKEGYEKC